MLSSQLHMATMYKASYRQAMEGEGQDLLAAGALTKKKGSSKKPAAGAVVANGKPSGSGQLKELKLGKLHEAKDGAKVLDYLTREGVKIDPNVPYGEHGDTPLHAYVRRRDDKQNSKLGCIMTFLINAPQGCDVDALNDEGDSPLHLACRRGDLLPAKALIALDADVNLFNKSNETPLDLAALSSDPLAELLQNIGGLRAEEILAELQMFGSGDEGEHGVAPAGGTTREPGSNEEENFTPLFDPSLMDVGSEESGVGMSGGGGASDGGVREGGGVDVNGDTAGEGLASIPEGEEVDGGDGLRLLSPDPSVMKGISKMSITSALSESDEAKIRSENPFSFLPKDSPVPALQPVLHETQPSPRPKSPQNTTPPPSRGPALGLSPARGNSPISGLSPARGNSPISGLSPARGNSPISGLSPARGNSPISGLSPARGNSPISGLSPARGNSPVLQRSRSPSPLAVSRQRADSHSPIASGGEELSSLPDQEDEQGPEERKQLEEMKMNYTKLFPSHTTVDSTDSSRVNGEGGGGEEGVREGKGEREDGARSGGVAAGGEEDKKKLMKKQGFVNYTEGEFFERLDQHTMEVYDKALEDSLGDEGYAAWLQYREIQRIKRDKKAFALDEDTDSPKDTSKEGGGPEWVMIPDQPKRPALKLNTKRGAGAASGPSKAPRHIHYNLPKDSIRRVRRPTNPESSIMQSISTINRNMSVTESVLGRSVRPMRRKARKDRGHRILCLDGGGVKGLVQLEVLRKIEDLTGKRITELFDWIVGTSTGGIVTLGSVYGDLTLKDLRKVYFEMKDTVFKKQSRVFTTACDTEALESLLKKFLGEEVLKENADMASVKKPRVMITAVEKRTTELPLVFFNNCFDDAFSTKEVWKVARCTSAAPGFFKEFENYIDGGVVANNPCNFGLVRIKQYLRQAKKEQKNRLEKPTISTDVACLVSVGCGIFPAEPLGNSNIVDALNFSKLKNLGAALKNTVTMLTTALTKSEDQANMCRVYCEELEIPFYRFNPEVGEQVGTAETDDMKLCESIIKTKQMLHENEDHLEEMIRYLGHTPLPKKII